MEEARLIFLVLAAGMFAVWLVVALRRRKLPPAVNVIGALHYGRWLRLFGLIVALSIPGLMAYVVWYFRWVDISHLIIAGVSLFAMSVLGGVLLLEAERVRLLITDKGLIGISPWRRKREVLWQEVDSVTYSPLNRWFVITGPGRRKIRASRSLVGIENLLKAVKANVPPPRYAPVQRYLETL
jgi:hypothetical protein